MSIARSFRRLVLSDSTYIASRGEFKRVIFTGFLSILCIVANLVYVILDVQENHRFNIGLNFAFCMASIISLALIRLKKYTVAKLLLLTTAYLIIFIYCILEPYRTGVYMFLILISIGAFAMFGYEQRGYSVSITLLGGILFLIAYVFDYRIWQVTYTDTYVYNNFLMNFFVVLITSVSIIYFLLDLNQNSEKTLEKKEAEALEKNKELTKLNAELDRFVYSVSHDLRSPLATISGLVNIGRHAESIDEAKRYFGMIDERIKTQDYFIREIIDFYRNSRTDINREELLLNDEIWLVINEFSFGENPLSIQYQLEIPADLKLRSDKIRLRSVLSNLIGNAVKYHDPDKSEKFIRISASQNNGITEISVEDNGLGIGEEHISKLFNMFYRASADSKGSGLGLFITRETVNRLGGNINVISALTKGSKFTFTVPQ